MFSYRLVHAGEFPSLSQGQAWPDLLSPREEKLLAGLGLVLRRRKWLLGRAAAKRLVRHMLGEGQVPEKKISVLNQPSGEPFVLIEGQGGWEYSIRSEEHTSELQSPCNLVS